MKTLVSAVLSIARGEIGVRETGDNSGARVRQYQASTTLGGSHWPWCAAFVSWAILQACGPKGAPMPWLNSASCDLILAWARAQELLRSTPQTGDAFLVRAKRGYGYSKTDAIHIGFVESVSGQNFATIEGNTNADGGREGHSVLKHTRRNDGRYYFVRWADLLPDAAAPVETPYTVAMMTAGQRVQIPSRMFNGSVLVAARDWADARRAKIEWDGESQAVVIAGAEVPFQPRFFEGRAYFSLRNLCEFAGAALSVDVAKRRVEVAG